MNIEDMTLDDKSRKELSELADQIAADYKKEAEAVLQELDRVIVELRGESRKEDKAA